MHVYADGCRCRIVSLCVVLSVGGSVCRSLCLIDWMACWLADSLSLGRPVCRYVHIYLAAFSHTDCLCVWLPAWLYVWLCLDRSLALSLSLSPALSLSLALSRNMKCHWNSCLTKARHALTKDRCSKVAHIQQTYWAHHKSAVAPGNIGPNLKTRVVVATSETMNRNTKRTVRT